MITKKCKQCQANFTIPPSKLSRFFCSELCWRQHQKLHLLPNKDARTRYASQKHQAKVRGILWELTFKQWWNLWQQSGHWYNRGRHSDQYCMARMGDKGTYEISNVKIILCQQNVRERRDSPEVRKKKSLFMKGRKHAAGPHKLDEAQRKAISLRFKGKTLPKAQRMKMSKSAKKRPRRSNGTFKSY